MAKPSIVNTRVGFSQCVAFSSLKGSQSLYHFVCECGKEFVRKSNTRNKAWFTQMNCGCMTKELLAISKARNKALKVVPEPEVKIKVDGLSCINCKHEIGYVCGLDNTDTGDHGECLQWEKTSNTGTLFCKDEHEVKGAILSESGYVKLKGV